MKNRFIKTGTFLIMLIFVVITMGIEPVSAKKKKTDNVIKTKVTELDLDFEKQDITYRINGTLCSAKSNKLYAQLCEIDNEYQVLYSKTGSSIAISNVEQKIRKDLKIDSTENITCYYMTQFDGTFYICFKHFPKSVDQPAYNYDESYEYDKVNYYVVETKNFKKYKTHYMLTRDKENKYLSEYDTRMNPKLYKASGIFFYMYDKIEKTSSAPSYRLWGYDSSSSDKSDYEASCELRDPIGYCGKSLDNLRELNFTESINYNLIDYDEGLTIQMFHTLSKDKIKVFVSLEYGDGRSFNSDMDDEEIIKKENSKRLSIYEANVTPNGKVDKWILTGNDIMSSIKNGEYEQFSTVLWNDESDLKGTTGIRGTDSFIDFSIPLGEYLDEYADDEYYTAFNEAYYGIVVSAKNNKKTGLSLKNTLFIPLLHKQSYFMDDKGNVKKINLPFDNSKYRGVTTSITQKGWSALTMDGCLYVSKDGFKTCKKVDLPCNNYSFVDIETYGEYIYVLAFNALYKLPLSVFE